MAISVFAAALVCAYVPMGPLARPAVQARAGAPAMDTEADMAFGLAPGQKYGPTAPAHPSQGTG